jgi:hypothetical protein
MNRRNGNAKVKTENSGRTEIDVNRKKFRESGQKKSRRQSNRPESSRPRNNKQNRSEEDRGSHAKKKMIRALKLGLLKKQNELSDLRNQLNNIPSNFMDMRRNILDRIAQVQADISRIKKRLKELGA